MENITVPGDTGDSVNNAISKYWLDAYVALFSNIVPFQRMVKIQPETHHYVTNENLGKLPQNDKHICMQTFLCISTEIARVYAKPVNCRILLSNHTPKILSLEHSGQL